MSKSDLRLDWATHEAADYACKNWHYAKRTPIGKTVKIGVWEEDSFIGVLIFSCGCAGVGQIYKRFNLPQTSVCELQRVALREHNATVTKIISVGMRMLKKRCPGIELCISYADPGQGHAGTIYKAGNWFPWGKSASDKEYIFSDGMIRHSRNVGENGKSNFGCLRDARKPSEAIKIINKPPKHRFLYPLGERGRLVIEALRAKQATDGHHPDGGGAAPTRALQSVASAPTLPNIG